MSALIEHVRRTATLIDHAIVPGLACVYCSAPVSPRLSRAGQTRNLDHFIPVLALATARHYRPELRLPNWLLPCCPRCNNVANAYLFMTIEEKHSFVCDQSPDLIQGSCLVSGIKAADDFNHLLTAPTDEGREYPIVCPRRDDHNRRWVLQRRIIRCWGGQQKGACLC